MLRAHASITILFRPEADIAQTGLWGPFWTLASSTSLHARLSFDRKRDALAPTPPNRHLQLKKTQKPNPLLRKPRPGSLYCRPPSAAPVHRSEISPASAASAVLQHPASPPMLPHLIRRSPPPCTKLQKFHVCSARFSLIFPHVYDRMTTRPPSVAVGYRPRRYINTYRPPTLPAAHPIHPTASTASSTTAHDAERTETNTLTPRCMGARSPEFLFMTSSCDVG